MRRYLTILGGLVLCAGWIQAAELDLTPLQRDLQFNFGNPGARALGMGGAFLGRADDASAAEANPAGLTVISKREFTLEFRNRKAETPFPLGVTAAANSASLSTELPSESISASKSGISFASFAMPLGPVAIAAYYHVPLDYEQSRSLATPVIRQPVAGATGNLLAVLPGDFQLSYKSTVIGLAAGWKVGSWSLGGSLKHQSIQLESINTTFGFNCAPAANGIACPSGTINKNSPRTIAQLSGDESKTTFNLGFLWSSANENVTVGGVYKKGADFDNVTTTRAEFVPLVAPAPGSAVAALNQGTKALPVASYVSPFQVPDRYGLGMSLRWHNGITFNEDIVRVKYSQLETGFRSGVFCDLFTAAGYADKNGNANPFCFNPAPGFSISDATEIHLGMEWQIPKSPVALRVGAWNDPSHRPEFDAAAAQTADLSQFQCVAPRVAGSPTPGCENVNTVYTNARDVAANYFVAGSSREIHYSVGIGYLARAFEIHGAYDSSEHTKTGSIQLLTRF
jgi:long-chain fatty acid transport protein